MAVVQLFSEIKRRASPSPIGTTEFRKGAEILILPCIRRERLESGRAWDAARAQSVSAPSEPPQAKAN